MSMMGNRFCTMDFIRSCIECKIRLNDIRSYGERCLQEAEELFSPEAIKEYELKAASITQTVTTAEFLLNFIFTLLEEEGEKKGESIRLIDPKSVFLGEEVITVTIAMKLLEEEMTELQDNVIDLYRILTELKSQVNEEHKNFN